MIWKIAVGVFSLFYLSFLLPRYLAKGNQNGILAQAKSKLALSGVFCMVGLIGIIAQGGNFFTLLIFGGLVFAFAGDYYLIYAGTDMDQYRKGIFSFGITQVCYLTAMAFEQGFHAGEFIAAAIVLLVLLVSSLKCKPDMGKAALPLTVYAFLVALMAAKAVLMVFSLTLPITAQLLFSFGALLFFFSDLFLGLWQYVNSKEIFRYFVDIFYFVGQLMIAASLLFL